MSELPDGKVVLVDVSGKGRVLDINLDSIQESLKEWAAMYGEGGDQNERLGIRITDEANAKSGGAFEGEGIDGKSEGNIEGKDDAEGKGQGKGKGKDLETEKEKGREKEMGKERETVMGKVKALVMVMERGERWWKR